MATAAIARGKDINFAWEGKDKSGKVMRGEMRAPGEAMVNATLRRQGIIVTKVKKQRAGRGGSVSDKDVTLFTRQLATMMKAGVPLLQSFDIVGKGHSNPSMSKLINDLRNDIETGTSLNNAFLMYPISILAIAFIVTAVIMIWVVPAFKSVFSTFGANLPAPTLMVMAISEFFVAWWYLIFG